MRESTKITALVSVSKKIGTGNLRRVLSILAEADRMGVNAEIITLGDIEVCENLLRMCAYEHKHYLNYVSLLSLENFRSRVIIDLPELSKDEVQKILIKCTFAVVFDDYFLRNLDVKNGFVISPNLHTSTYKPHANYLHGELYLIIPAYKSIIANRDQLQSDGSKDELFINFGGTDPMKLTTSVLDWICQFGGGATYSIVVVGGIHEAVLPTIRNKLPVNYFEYCPTLDPHEFIKKMSSADYCIGSFGMAGWERLISGKPSLAFQVAENQKLALEYFRRNQLAVVVTHEELVLNPLGAIDAGMRNFFSKLLMPSWWNLDALAVDGLGINRVAQLICGQLKG